MHFCRPSGALAMKKGIRYPRACFAAPWAIIRRPFGTWECRTHDAIPNPCPTCVQYHRSRGWHLPGVVAICAWPRALWVDYDQEFYAEHRGVFERLGVAVEKRKGSVLCRFTEAQVKAYQLLHILLHELGHHHDRMTTRSRRDSARGEHFAEQYALRYEQTIWERYVEIFGLG